MLKEFREFMARGNIVDLAVAVIIGAAFGKVVDSLVKDVVMPPIGMVLGKVDFSTLFINLSSVPYATLAEAQKAAAPTINYGLFLNQVITFVIVAFTVFLLIRQVNRRRRTAEQAAHPTVQLCPFCFTEIPLNAKRCPHCTSQLNA